MAIEVFSTADGVVLPISKVEDLTQLLRVAGRFANGSYAALNGALSLTVVVDNGKVQVDMGVAPDILDLVSNYAKTVGAAKAEVERLTGLLKIAQEHYISLMPANTASQGIGGTTRAKNDKSLKEVVIDILAEHQDGLDIGELTTAVLATGYKSNSDNFKNVLYQTLYNSQRFFHEPNGNYKLVAVAS